MRRILWFAGLALALFTVLIGFETLQSDEPVSMVDLVLEFTETALLVGAVVATAYFSVEAREFSRHRAGLMADLSRAQAEGDRWRATARQHINGLSQAIQRQFAEWKLSDGECDIAVLMLKGLSHKEIARLRDTSEATVRQQARAIYRKSNLSSRTALAAFFLEDLLAPSDDRPAAPPAKITLVDPSA